MGKSIGFLLFGMLMFSGLVFADFGKVIVLDLSYNEGNISVVNSTVKYGYFPDRRFEESYKLEIMADDGVIYGTSFKDSSIIFVDASSEDGITGGMIKLEETRFSLVLPYYDNMDEIRFYNSLNELKGVQVFENSSNMWILFVVLGIILFGLLAVIFKIKYR